MPDTDGNAPATAPAPSAPAAAPEPVIMLEEFCLRHSKVERSVELLNAFFAIESHAGRTAATASEFLERIAAFARKPAV